MGALGEMEEEEEREREMKRRVGENGEKGGKLIDREIQKGR